MEGHDCSILALAVNSSGILVASGDEKGKIILWSDALKFLHKFEQHKSAITGLAFRRNAPEMYSCSVDKTVKVSACSCSGVMPKQMLILLVFNFELAHV